MATPSSRQVAKSLCSEDSISVLNALYSICTQAIGWMAWARRRVADETSDSPMWRILPCLEKSINCCPLTIVENFFGIIVRLTLSI